MSKMTSQHKYSGGHYSSANPIPNIQKFIEVLDRGKNDRDKEIDKKSKNRNPEFLLNTDTTKNIVMDPTTGNEVEIEDTSSEFMELASNPKLSVPNANLNKEAGVSTSANQSNEIYRKTQDKLAPPDQDMTNSTSDVPIKGQKTNILFHPTPSIDFEPMFEVLERKANYICLSVLISIIFFGKLVGGVLYGLIPLSLCISLSIFLWMKDLIQKGRSNQWKSEKKRGQFATVNLIPESVEWVNFFLEVIWGLIDPEKFSAIADMLEDVMHASVPAIIENVRVAGINQGNNPFRILSLRALPEKHVDDCKEKTKRRSKRDSDLRTPSANNEDGTYYNLECSFAYQARATSNDVQAKAKNMHIHLVFYIGIKGFFGVPFPVFVELQSLVGTMRVRLQMSPESPFLKNLTFTFMGLPKIQASCTPLVQTGIDILGLPLISNFVNKAIGTVVGEYVAPKSMTLDVGKYLLGDDIQKEVDALGILWIRIHKAVGLSKQDRRGSEGGGCDSYITISFSKYGKPMYSTRVIQDDLNPIWLETCALIVTPDLIKIDENLSVEMWDSDRLTADDVVGKVQLSLQQIIQNPGIVYSHISNLQGVDQNNSIPGQLYWEVGWFYKAQISPDLRTDGKNVNLPDQLKDMKEFQDEKGIPANDQEDAIINTPPDPMWPSGICSIVIHQIINLELQNIKGSNGKRRGREYEPAVKNNEVNEEDKGLPSSYCTILFNDELIYRTRTKVLNSRPIFNAGTERFIRDWRHEVITVTVRDQRMREHDPILGVISLKIPEILQKSSQLTRWYPLEGGIGYGRIRLSILFRSIEIILPPQQLGWDVGTFEVDSNSLVATGYKSLSSIKMRTGGSSGKVPRSQCQRTEKEDGVYWDISQNIRLPVKYRYRSPVVFEFNLVNKRGVDAYAVIWLDHIEDNITRDFRLPIWKTDNGLRLTQNHITEHNLKEVFDLKVEKLGYLIFSGRFKTGIDLDHKNYITDNNSRETHETWEACFSEGLRDVNSTEKASKVRHNSNELSVSSNQETFLSLDKKLKNETKRHSDIIETEESASDLNPEASHGQGISGIAIFDEGSSNIIGSNSSCHNEDHPSFSDSSSCVSPFGTSCHDKSDEDVALKQNQIRKDANSRNPLKQIKLYNEKKDILHRKHRGVMQWKPIRNLDFVKNETKFLVRRTLQKSKLHEKKPKLETEI